MEFNVGDHVFLKVSPLKGSLRFGQKAKLTPRYIGPFEILQRIGPVATWEPEQVVREKYPRPFDTGM